MSSSGIRARAVSQGGPLSVPRSKFGCPAVPARAIARPRLGEVLAQPGWRVALITGGPATGKTVSAAQWFQALGPVAREWVTLDADDDRPERFWLTFVLGLERAVPGAFAQAAAADVHRLPSAFLDRLLTAWSAVDDPLVIVLEDVHHLRSPQITEDLGFVVEHLPAASRMLLTGRADPPLPVSRWRGRSWLAELRQRDLALTLPETAELFTALGEQRLSTSQIETLWRHTEGWVAGLRLAAAGLRDRADVAAAVDEFSGRTPMVADLLADELLHRAPAELSEFLLRTSVADVLDAGLCDALSGRSDSAEVLRHMEADLQFVMATGPGRDTWRYHPLLAARIALRQGRLSAAGRQARAALEAAGAFGLDTHPGAIDAHLALAGVLIDRNELAAATATFRLLDQVIAANPFTLVYQVLVRLEKVRVAAPLDDWDEVFATVREAAKLIDHVPRSALRCLIDAAAARWHLEAGQAHQAGELIATLPDSGPAHTLLRARLDLACGRFDAVQARLGQASPGTMRDQVTGELLLARAAIGSGEDPGGHMMAAAGLAAPEHLVRVFLDEGPAVARLAWAAAESLGTESGTALSVALGSLPPLPRRTPPAGGDPH
jgi:MalT-like TPR region